MSSDTTTVLRIDGLVKGDILPGNRNEMLRDILLEEGFDIQGSVYCNTLNIAGSGRISGSVMTKQDVVLDGQTFDEDGQAIFERDVTSGRVVDIKSRSAVPPGKYGMVVRGNLVGETIRLENSLVTGNVAGSDVFLKDCMVCGLVHAEGRLVLENSCVVSFRGGYETELKGRNTLWLPYATFRGNLTANEESQLRYLLFCLLPPACGKLRISWPANARTSSVRHRMIS